MFLPNKIQFMAAMCLLGATPLANALPDEESHASAFVDSVYEWGTWELGIEPAAGGPAPMSDRALNVRLSNVKFRPNDNSTFSPGASRIAVITPVPPAIIPPVITPPAFSFPSAGTPPTTGTSDPFR